MPASSRRKFCSSVFKLGSLCFMGPISAAFAGEQKNSLIQAAPPFKNHQKLLYKSVKLDRDNSWGNQHARLLRGLLKTEPCAHLTFHSSSGAPWAKRIEIINTHINKAPYVSDQDQYNREDVWAMPHHFLQNGGDCEDFALAKFSYLAHANIAPERLFILGLQNKDASFAHASLGVMFDDGLVILDNRRSKPYQENEYSTEFNLAYALNIHGLWRT